MDERRHVRFVVLAVGSAYREAARTLVKSLELCDFSSSVHVYTDSYVPIPPARIHTGDYAPNGFGKLDALCADLRGGPAADLYVCIDADMEVIDTLHYHDLDPGHAGVFCVQHFLPPSESLWNVGPACSAWTPKLQWSPVYWQTCLWGGYRTQLERLLSVVTSLIHHSQSHQGAWEEPYLNRRFCLQRVQGRPIRTIGCEFARPVWRDTQPQEWRGIYELASGGRPTRIQHHNQSRRGG
jgi:hypothetical protein